MDDSRFIFRVSNTHSDIANVILQLIRNLKKKIFNQLYHNASCTGPYYRQIERFLILGDFSTKRNKSQGFQRTINVLLFFHGHFQGQFSQHLKNRNLIY